jgi:hypothetical protein
VELIVNCDLLCIFSNFEACRHCCLPREIQKHDGVVKRKVLMIPKDHPAPLRICLLSYRSNPHCGGQGVYVQHLSRALKKKDGKVTLVGFGTFQKTRRKARKGRNPQTGAVIKIKASPVFSRA